MVDFTSFLGGLASGVVTFPFLDYLRRRLPAVNERGYQQLLPWEGVFEDGLITSDGALVSIYRFRGPDLTTVEEEELAYLRGVVESLIKAVPSYVKFQWTLLHQRAEDSLPRRNRDQIPDALWALDKSRNERMKRGFTRAQYLTVRVDPQSASLETLTQQWRQTRKEVETHLDTFSLEPLEDEALLNYLNTAALVPWTILQRPKVYEPATTLEHDGDVLKIEDVYVSAVVVLSYPETLYHECVPLDINVNARFTSSVYLPEVEVSRSELNALRRKWNRQRYNLLDLALKQVALAPEAAENLHVRTVSEAIAGYLATLQAGENCLGKVAHTMILWDSELALLEEETRYVVATLRARGFSVLRESWGLAERFLASLPGAQPSTEIFSTTEDISRILPITSIWTGSSPSGGPLDGASPVFTARRSGTRADYRFDFSNIFRGVGHTIVLGPTGAGKSTLLTFLTTQWIARYASAKAVTIDYGKSALPAIEKLDGTVYGVAGGIFAVNLLERIDEPRLYHSALGWLTRMGSLGLGRALAPGEKAVLSDALEALGGEAPHRRRLRRFADLVQDAELYQVFSGYCSAGPLGNMLDSEDSTVIEEALWNLFEMESLLRMEDEWSIPVLDALLLNLSQLFQDKLPIVLVMDEVWRLLQHPVFAESIKEYLLTLRKLNVSVVLASQNTLDFEPAFLKTLFQQCSTRIFLADKSANGTSKSMYMDLGLTEGECALISGATPRRDYYVVTEVGSALINLELSAEDLEFLT